MYAKRLIRTLGAGALVSMVALLAISSEAQAKYLLLLNGQSVSLLRLNVIDLLLLLKAENGFDLHCTDGTGTKDFQIFGGGIGVNSASSMTWKKCKWVGAEITCTINDGGEGIVHAGANGEVIMPDSESYKISETSSELMIIHTEGIFCTIPEEEVVSGTMGNDILNALTDSKTKVAHHSADDLKLGNSKIIEAVGEEHLSDADNPNATVGIHLVEL